MQLQHLSIAQLDIKGCNFLIYDTICKQYTIYLVFCHSNTTSPTYSTHTCFYYIPNVINISSHKQYQLIKNHLFQLLLDYLLLLDLLHWMRCACTIETKNGTTKQLPTTNLTMAQYMSCILE